MQCRLRSLTNSRLRKVPTSSVVDGPPIFMKTIAVGPWLPAVEDITGGVVTVASLRVLSRAILDDAPFSWCFASARPGRPSSATPRAMIIKMPVDPVAILNQTEAACVRVESR